MHHERNLSDEMEKIIQCLELGATGRFPEGKLTENDEGELRFAVTVYKGKVVFNFGTPVASMGMLPEQALVLGRALMRKAREAKEEASVLVESQSLGEKKPKSRRKKR